MKAAAPVRRGLHLPLFLLAAAMTLTLLPSAGAQVNGAGQKPYLGWSSFSQQTIDSNFLTQANMVAQSDALKNSGLQAHGWKYINLDSGWMGSFDANGRPIPNASFPDIKGLFDHIHANGQKAGIYWIPGVEQPAVDANYPILGTQYHIKDILTVPYTAGNAFGGSGTSPYHYKIDFTKPGAQEYMNSVVALFASWGVDLIKLDGVTPGSYSNGTNIDNRGDVAAWSKAIAASGRPIWLTISWSINQDYLADFLPYQNARRIEDDIECEGRCGTLTNWNRIYQRFRDLPGWQYDASPSKGWNDLDSLDIGDGALDGLTLIEKETAVSLWAIAGAPMYLGGDLTKIDNVGKLLATNDEVLAVNQSGKPGKQVLGGDLPVWVSEQGHNTYYVALSNTNATPSVVRLPWKLLGFTGATQVRDLWLHLNLGSSNGTFTTVVPGHGTALLKVVSNGKAAPALPATTYEAENATLNGSASIANCARCSGGEKVGNFGLGANNTVSFENVRVKKAGVYLMQVDSMTQGLRSYIYWVNGVAHTLNSGGGSFEIPSSTVLPVELKAGDNTIVFGSPVSYPPDLDRIVIRGSGDAPLPSARTYEAEIATLSGSVSGGFSNYSSGLAKAGNIGGGAGNAVTFADVTVPSNGTYLLEVDYLTSGARSFFLTINDGSARELALNGSTFDEPANTVVQVSLKAGVNTLRFDNTTGYAPDLDRIVVAPRVLDNLLH